MKRFGILTPALALAVTIGLVACGESVNSAPPSQSATPFVLDDSRPDHRTVHQGLPADVLRLRQASIRDAGFFGREMVAMTLMVPADWQDRGAVTWADTLCQTRMQQIQWEAFSPNGRERIQIMPAEGWKYARDNMSGHQADPNGCPGWTFTSLREYFEAWVAHHRPNARVLDFEVDPVTSQALAATLPTMPPMEGTQSQNRAEAGRVLLAYQENGVEYREVLTTGVVIVQFQMVMSSYGAGPDFHMESLNGGTLPMFTARAPAGELDFNRLEVLGNTLSMNPEYSAEVSRFFAGLNRTIMDGERERHGIRMDTINYIGQLNRDSYNSRIDSMDRSSHQFSQTMREVQTWVDPVSHQPVELPMHYRNAWRMSDGTYLMTNNDGFDPWRDLQLSGDRMKVGR
jgi:hypothetical protein